MAFRLFTNRSRKQDMMLLSGWLFADLLLGLVAIFLGAMPPAPPPTLLVDKTALTTNDCQQSTDTFTCKITLTESSTSQGKVNWKAASDMNDTSDNNNAVTFDPPTGTLSPNQSTTITISNIPCQNGSFAVKGSRKSEPTVILWQCRQTQVKLEDNYISFTININDVDGLLSNSPSVVADIEQQLINEPALQNRSVGLALVYGGTGPGDPPNTQLGYNIADAIYNIMRGLAKDDSTFTAFKRAVYYNDLYFLYGSPSVATIHLYLFQQ